MSAKDLVMSAAGSSGDAVYIDDCFSTYLYTGNGSTQTINNGIDLAGKGGLVWLKMRSLANGNGLYDTVRGAGKILITNGTNAESSSYNGVSSFNSAGFSLGADFGNQSAQTYASWTFRKQPKFFDVVTYTGNGVAGRQIAHSLGSVPGCIIVKAVQVATGSTNWCVYHASATGDIYLNSTNAQTASHARISTPNASTFTVDNDADCNKNGDTYVAYLFAHNAGGFGLTGTDNVISCGSFTTDASGNATVNLGYEPQWILIKNTQLTENWVELDSMRGWSFSSQQRLFPNLSNAEQSLSGNYGTPTATGFNFISLGNSNTYIYIAIRRPMKVPTSGTSVFDAGTRSGSSSNALTNSDILTDLAVTKNYTSGSEYWAWTPRLVGAYTLQSNSTDAELSGAMTSNPWDTMVGAECAAFNGATNSGSLIDYSFRRAPGFFDVVCYTGTGVAMTVNHNLGVAPELMIVKQRNSARDWVSYISPMGNNYFACLNDGSFQGSSSTMWNDTTPMTSVFTVGTNIRTNVSAGTYVAYLFASCPGVQYINSFTGNGTSQTINCGFSAGARFVMIKATSTTGNWWVFDSARGIVAAADPVLALNSTAAEITSADAVDPVSSGFIVNQEATCNLNATGVTYLVWAIA